MEFEERIAALRAAILEAFARDEPPRQDRIALHQCEECAGLRADFAEMRWNLMPPALIEKHYGSLPLLSPEALAYFLPAYLLYALDHFTPDSLVTEFVVYHLAPDAPHDQDAIEWRRAKLRHFTRQQIAVVNDFLLLVEGDEAFRVYLGDVGPGRRRTMQYWEDRWDA